MRHRKTKRLFSEETTRGSFMVIRGCKRRRSTWRKKKKEPPQYKRNFLWPVSFVVMCISLLLLVSFQCVQLLRSSSEQTSRRSSCMCVHSVPLLRFFLFYYLYTSNCRHTHTQRDKHNGTRSALITVLIRVMYANVAADFWGPQ